MTRKIKKSKIGFSVIDLVLLTLAVIIWRMFPCLLRSGLSGSRRSGHAISA